MTIANLLTEATTVIPTAISSIWEMATSNPLLMFSLGVGILGVGFSIFRKVRKTAH